jgi:hypothetical protein
LSEGDDVDDADLVEVTFSLPDNHDAAENPFNRDISSDWRRCHFVSANTDDNSLTKNCVKDPGVGWYFSGELQFLDIKNFCRLDLPTIGEPVSNNKALMFLMKKLNISDATTLIEQILPTLRNDFFLPHANADDFSGKFYKVLYDRSQNEKQNLSSYDSEVFHSFAHYHSRKTGNRSMYGFRGNGSLRSCYAEIKALTSSSTWAGSILFYFVVTHSATGRRLGFARIRWFDVPDNSSDAKAMASKLVGGATTLNNFCKTAKKLFPECPTFRYQNSGGLPFRIGEGNINLEFLGNRKINADDTWVDVGTLVSKICVAPLETNYNSRHNGNLSNAPNSTRNCIFAFWQQHAMYGHV